MKPSVQLHLITRREKQGGKYPVKIRIIYQRTAKDFPIGIDLTEFEFKSCTGHMYPPDQPHIDSFHFVG